MGLKPRAGSCPVISDLNTKLWFGRYNGQLLKDVLHDDPAYLVWAQESIKDFDLSHELLELAENNGKAEEQTEYYWRNNLENGT